MKVTNKMQLTRI